MSPVAHSNELQLIIEPRRSFHEPSRSSRRALPSIQAEELLQLIKASPAAHSMSPVAHSNELQLIIEPRRSFHEPSRSSRRALPSIQADELLQLIKASPAAHSMSPVAHSNELQLIIEPRRSFHEPSRSSRRALPSIQADELLQLIKASPAAHSMSPVAHSNELQLIIEPRRSFHEPSRSSRRALPSIQADELLQFIKASPAAHSMSPVAHSNELQLIIEPHRSFHELSRSSRRALP